METVGIAVIVCLYLGTGAFYMLAEYIKYKKAIELSKKRKSES